MSARITLTVTAGPLMGEKFVFDGPTVCTVGRSHECILQIAGGEADLTASRRHCVLDIAPPAVSIRDLGSRNGTYVNGKKIERRVGPLEDLPGIVLQKGDEVKVGCSVLVLGIEETTSSNPGEKSVVPDYAPVSTGQVYASCC